MSSDKKPDKEEHNTMLKQKVSPAEEQEVMRPPKKRCTVNMMSNKSFEASDKAKGEGATVSQEAQVGTLPGSSNDYSQKCAQSQRKPVAGEAVLPSPADSPPDHSLHRKDDDDITVTGGSVSGAHSAGTVNAPVMPSAESGPSASLPSPNVTNHEIKCALMTEIRRYGRQYGKIFKILEEVPGPLEVRIQFVEFTIKEAARFKRHHLINYLEKILEKLMAERSLNNGDLHPSV